MKTKQAEREEEEKNRREADRLRRLQEAALEKEKEEHRFSMKMAIDKLRESETGRKIIEVIGEEELYTYDPNSLNSLHIDAIIKHNREQKEKLRIHYKKIDYLIRAMHETELPLIEHKAKEEMCFRYRIQNLERQHAIENRQRLLRMDEDKNYFLQTIRDQRQSDFIERINEFNQRLEVARRQRLKQLRQEYIEEKKENFRKERKSKQQRKLEEKQQKIQAEFRRKEKERLELLRIANEEKYGKLDDQARKQREREAEIERKLQADKDRLHSMTTSCSSSSRRGGSGAMDSSHSQAKHRIDRFEYTGGPKIIGHSLPLSLRLYFIFKN